MNKLDEIRQRAYSVSLAATEEFINVIHQKRRYKILSPYPTINSIDCEIVKGERCFKYYSGEILPIGPPAKFQSKSYGFQDPFDLENDTEKLSVYNGANTINRQLGEEFKSSGEIWEIQSSTFSSQSYLRTLLPLSGFNKKPVGLIQSDPFKIGKALRVAGFVNILIGNNSIGIYDYKIKDKEFLIIECYQLIDSKYFEQIVSAIIYSFGLISGSLVRDELYLIQYTDNTFNHINGFHYRRIEDSKEGLSSFDARLFDQFKGTGHSAFPREIFQSLIKKCLDDNRLLRAMRIITESADYPIDIRASVFSVALETMKNIILEENVERINPFKSKATASKLIKSFHEKLNSIDPTEFNNRESVQKRIEQLNQVGNKEGFILSFKLLEIVLNEDDRICLEKRNDFLHGRLPYEGEFVREDNELQHFVYKQHFLLTALVFKLVGYKGHLINNWKLVDLIHFKKRFNEPLFRVI
jgi:hypothetical protein